MNTEKQCSTQALDSKRAKYGFLASIIGISVNILLAGVKLAVGLFTASIAIIADALNNFSDAGSSIVTYVSFKMSSKPADRDHPFGHARIEYIASMIVSFLILLVGFETITKSTSVLLGISESEKPDFSTVSLIIIGLSILVKIALSVFYRIVGNKINSSVIKASSTDSLMDSISTFAVLVASIVIKISGFEKIDAIVGIGVSIMIIVAGVRILNETKNSLLGEAPVEEIVDAIMQIISTNEDIIGTHDLMIHNYGPNKYIASLHAEVDGKKDIYILHDMIDNVEKKIQNNLGILCTIHMDPIVTDDEQVNELKAFVTKTINENIDKSISIHDFRIVVGHTHTNMIFDILLPYESKYSPDEITSLISTLVQNEKPNHYCVITVDRG